MTFPGVAGRFRPGPRAALAACYGLGLLLLYQVQYYRLGSWDSSAWVTGVALVLLLAAEAALTLRFEGAPESPASRLSSRRRAVLLAGGWIFRSSLWVAAFVVGVEIPARIPAGSDTIFARAMVAYAWDYVWPVLSATPLLSALGAALWLLLLEAVVVRRRLLRGVVVAVLPAAMLFGLLQAQYQRVLQFDLPTAAAVEAQEGVVLAFDVRSVADPELRRLWAFGKTLSVEEETGTAYASFGMTLDHGRIDPPNLWQVDLATGRYRTLNGPQVRAFGRDPANPVLLAFPWHEHAALRIDKATFQVLERVDYRGAVDSGIWEPVDAVDVPPFVFVAMNGVPLVLKVDARDGRLAGVLDLRAAGIRQTGDHCCMLARTPLDPDLFVVSRGLTGGDVVRVDPDDLSVKARGTLPRLPFHSVATDAPPAELFVLSEYAGSLFRMGVGDLQARRAADAPAFAAVAYDRRLDRLVVTDPSAGTVTLLDRDGRVERVVTVGDRPRGLAVTERGIYVQSALGVVRIDH